MATTPSLTSLLLLPFLPPKRHHHPRSLPFSPPHHHHHRRRRRSRHLLSLQHPSPRPLLARSSSSSTSSSSAAAELDMVRGRDGVWSARPPTVVVLWDLDNKPPRGPPFPAASSLLSAASLLGRVLSASAFANRHAFSHLPSWVLSIRRSQRHLDLLERGSPSPSPSPSPYPCPLCGRRCPTRLALKRHFRLLHERERLKNLARLRSLKSKKKRARFRARFLPRGSKYDEAAHSLLTPKSGYGLAAELRRAGVAVRTVQDKPQAADAALKRQMQHSMTRGVDWMVLVSDDSDFAEMLRKAREAELRTVVVGDARRALGRAADIWLPWARVESGEIGEEALQTGRRDAGFPIQEAEDAVQLDLDLDLDLDGVVDGIAVRDSGFDRSRISAFSDEELVDDLDEDEFYRAFGRSEPGNHLLWHSEEEDDDDDDDADDDGFI